MEKVFAVFSSLPVSPTDPSAGSPVTSPIKHLSGLFQKKEEEEGDATSQKNKGLQRSKTGKAFSSYYEPYHLGTLSKYYTK